jgi:hypothetical protein
MRNKELLPWSTEEQEMLKMYFPRLREKEILEVLEGRSWLECCREAERLGIKRLVTGREKKPGTVIGKLKLQKLLDNDYTVEEIAKKLKSTPEIVRRNIRRYDL